MIKYYGIFQLVKVTKETKTSKSKEPMVYFTAASNRSKDESDFKLFKMYGKNVENFISNLEKEGDKYKSRRMLIEGYVETYQEEQEVVCSCSVKKDKLPSKYGNLTSNFKVEAKTTIKVDKDIYVVSHFTFVDNKGKGNKTVIVDSDDEDDGTYFVDDDSDDNNSMEAAATSDINMNNSNSNSKTLYRESKSASDELDKFKKNTEYKYNSVLDMV